MRFAIRNPLGTHQVITFVIRSYISTHGAVPYSTVPYRTVQVANLICSYRVSCETICFMGFGISRIVRDTTVVRITRPSSFSFWFGVAFVRTICERVSSYRALFEIISTSIRNNPSTFLQNTYTILVRTFLFIFCSHSKLIGNRKSHLLLPG